MKYFYFFFIVLASSHCLLPEVPKGSSLIVQNASTSESNEEAETSPLMLFGLEKKPSEEKSDPNRSRNLTDPHDERRNSSGEDKDDSSIASRSELSHRQNISEREEENEGVITLDHFREALENYPDATRLIILEEKESFCIQPREAPSDGAGITRGENRKILKKLKALITDAYSGDIAASFSQLNAMALLRAEPLSSESLRNIIESLPSESNPERLVSLAPLESRHHEEENIIAEKKEELQKAADALLSPSPDSVFAESLFLEEKARVAKMMQQMIKVSKSERDWKEYYKDVDELWAQSQKDWEERTMATWKVEETAKALAQAEELLQRAKTVLENTDLNTTTLGRISSLTGKAADVLSKVPNEYAQVVAGFMGSISTGAGVANQLRAQAPVTIAEVTKMLAERTATQAEEARKQANQAAPTTQKTAEEMESQAREQERRARKELVERLDPPVTNLSEKEWVTWATLLVQAGKGNPILIPLLAEHGLVDPLGAAEIIHGAWNEAEEELLYAEVKEKKLRIAPFEKDFTQTSAALKKANDLVVAAEAVVTKLQDRLKSALAIREHWKTQLEETSGALDELEKKENRRKSGNAEVIESKKKEFSDALSEFNEACIQLPAIEKELAAASAALAAEEEKASLLSNEVARAKTALQRNQERIAVLQERRDQKATRRTFRLPRLIERGEESLSLQNLTAAALSSAAGSPSPSQYLTSLPLAFQKKQKTPKIEPPLLLDKVYEIIGRSLLWAEDRNNRLTAAEATMEALSLVRAGTIPEIRNPTPDDVARWKALEKAKEYIEENEFLKATIKARLPQPVAAHEIAAPKLESIQEEDDFSEEGSDLDEGLQSAITSTLLPAQSGNIKRRKAPSVASSLASSAIEKSRSASVASYIRIGKGGGSVAGSIPASIRSAATAVENKALNKTLDVIDHQAKEWAAMVLRADQTRIAQERAAGLTPFLFPEDDGHKSLLEAWQQADAVAEAGWKKKCSMQEEEKREEEMAATWEPDTCRWEARARVKALETEQNVTKQELQDLLENKSPLQAVFSLLTTTSQEKKTKAEANLKQISKELEEAEAKWNQLAEEESRKKSLTLEQVKDQDDAVLTLFERVMEEEGQEKEIEIARNKKARLRAEGESYKETLITKRDKAVTPYLAAPVNQEEEARGLYFKATMEEALAAARTQIPRAEKAWETRISMAKAAEKKADQLAKDAPHETMLLTAERMKRIREIDEQALLALQQESKRLEKIELVWKREIEKEKKAPALDRLAAARAFHLQANRDLWERKLPSEEREIYNDFITFANEVTHTSDTIALQETKEWAEELRATANQLQKKFTVFSSTKKAAHDMATEAEGVLRELISQAAQKKESINWGKLTPKERLKIARVAKISEWKNHVATAFTLARKAKDESSWERARVAAMEAVGYWEGVIEKIKSHPLGYTQEEATLQRDRWMVKADLAEVKTLTARPYGDNWRAEQDRADEITSLIRKKMWPTVSKTMRDFLFEKNSNEEMLLLAKGIIADAACASACASAYASAYASGAPPASAYASGAASASTYASTYAYAYTYTSAYISDSAYAPASASASASLTTSVISAHSVEEASEAAEALAFLKKISKQVAGDFARANFPTAEHKANVAWVAESAEEMSQFATGVLDFKRKQPGFIAEKSKPLSPEKLKEKASLVAIKALLAKPCGDSWRDKEVRAHEIMKMTRERFSSPLSAAMRAFMENPSPEILAAAHPASARMDPEEASEAAEIAEVFAQTAKNDAARWRIPPPGNSVVQKNLDYSETITREIADFARAVAAFKNSL